MIPPHLFYQIYLSFLEQNYCTPPKCGELSEYTDSAHTEVEDPSLGCMNVSNVYGRCGYDTRQKTYINDHIYIYIMCLLLVPQDQSTEDAPLNDTTVVVIKVIDEDDMPPKFSREKYTGTVIENSKPVRSCREQFYFLPPDSVL